MSVVQWPCCRYSVRTEETEKEEVVRQCQEKEDILPEVQVLPVAGPGEGGPHSAGHADEESAEGSSYHHKN